MKLSDAIKGFAKDQASIDRVNHWRNTVEDIQNHAQTDEERRACGLLLDQIRAGSNEEHQKGENA